MALSRNNEPVVVKNIISNTEVNLICIIEDKLKNILVEHESKMKKRRDWISASGFFITSATAFFTLDFHCISDMEIVKATLLGELLIFSFGYLIYTIYNIFTKKDSVDSIIQDIKKSKTTP